MSRQVFVAHSSRDERSVTALRAALERAGLETTTAKERATPNVPIQQAIDEAVGVSDLVIVILPPHGEGWMRAEVEAARKRGKPIVVVQTPASRSPDPDLRKYLTVRSDLREPETVVNAVQNWLRHRPSRPVGHPPPRSALSAQEVVQWVATFRDTGELLALSVRSP